ncbi:hypothetical protein CXB51_025011 [Gossypium anomalum]|uniref:Calmodulin-binding domain-containing protein n=1 Tax=Gossypium anomalum TaxID=47600 RepID=A0A8J6CU14_9ROSI|nr:hypothetical protein CXB51_025011 [Gossypium anomalum]
MGEERVWKAVRCDPTRSPLSPTIAFVFISISPVSRGTKTHPLKMLQRKVANKLEIGIQADHHIDGKNKGTDLKKKMKKCRSIKLSDMKEGLRSSSPLVSRKTISEPVKPSPPHHNNSRSIIKGASNGSPNYMKSTSSSEAKKETSASSQASSRRKSSASGLTRTSSLKLTKTPSFKPVRASARKCSKVALRSDMNVQKATCSSTLKDSKFPAYLMLNPGGTEYEGTSIVKVCSYTYCSLNGRHHAPLPPLKCFLKARRRSMKVQRSMKVEALSPRKVCGDGTEELNYSMDFFVEIYGKSKGEDSSECGNETAPEPETESRGSLNAEIDFGENVEHGSEVVSQVDTNENEEFRGISAKEESSPWSFNDGDKREGVSSADMDDTMFEVIDMEWDEWPFSASQSGDEACSAIESDTSMEDSSETVRNDMTEEGVTGDNECTNDIDTCSQVSETLCYDQVLATTMDEEHGGPTSGKEEMLENGVPATINERNSRQTGNVDVAGLLVEANDAVDQTLEEHEDTADGDTRHKPRSKAIVNEELPEKHTTKWTIGHGRHDENNDELKTFNPREPNFLSVVPETDKEKVDLRHQMMEERRNAEEWMLDHALQQAVTKLGPAKKKKVALLVEAFETVLPLPITKCETHLRHHTSTGFAHSHGRTIQACN